MTGQGNREEIKKKLTDELRASLTEKELERIKFQRDFDQVDIKSPDYKLGIEVDPLRVIKKKTRQEIEKKLWNINNMLNQQQRLIQQSVDGKITEQLKDGVTMTHDELLTEIEHVGWLIQSEVDSLPVILWQMRGIVGQHDVAKQIIMSQEDFTKLVNRVVKRLEEHGLSLFET